MSERKRFPDEVIAAGHEVLASLHFACDPEECEHLDEEEAVDGFCTSEDQKRLVDAIVTDHLQAREDVKRLAKRLRERQGGACCERARTQCEDCAGDLVLLAEVDPK